MLVKSDNGFLPRGPHCEEFYSQHVNHMGHFHLFIPVFISLVQADVDISFEISDFEKAEVLKQSWTNPQLLCGRKDASVKGSLGPFGLLVLGSKDLKENTAVFFRIFKSQNKYVVLMCSDQSRSPLTHLQISNLFNFLPSLQNS